MITKEKKGLSHKNYKIKICKNGPHLVSGGVPLLQKIIKYDSKWDSCEWKDDKTFPFQDTYTLCRCGHSDKKPFCDGTHTRINFDGTETADPKTYYKNVVTLDCLN
jgi:CDGSH-type Zn-finger protein